MPIYNISFAQAHAGGAFMTQPTAETADPVKLTQFERAEINLYLADWSRSGGDAAVAGRVKAAIDKLDIAQMVTVNANGALPDLSPWLIDVRRSDADTGRVSPIMLRQLAHWRAGGDDREEAYQAIIKKIDNQVPEFTVRYAGDLPDLSSWGITIHGLQSLPGAAARALDDRAVANVPALARRTVSSVRDLIRDIPQAALWTGTQSAWSARCVQVFGQTLQAIEALAVTTAEKRELLKTLMDTYQDRTFKYAAQDKNIFGELNYLREAVGFDHARFRERLELHHELTDWRVAKEGREVAYQKILRALDSRGAQTSVTVTCDGAPPRLWGLGVEVRLRVVESKSPQL
jgi:hypothetical protein